MWIQEQRANEHSFDLNASLDVRGKKNVSKGFVWFVLMLDSVDGCAVTVE